MNDEEFEEELASSTVVSSPSHSTNYDDGDDRKKTKKLKKKKKKRKHDDDHEEDQKEEKDMDTLGLYLTPTERRHLERKHKDGQNRLFSSLKTQSHRDRINAFNHKLESMSEHHDVPRVSAAGNG